MNSIIDGTSESAVAFSGIDAASETAGGALTIENSTIIGKVRTVEFVGVERDLRRRAGAERYLDGAGALGKKQSGCVRFACAAGLADAASLPLPTRSGNRCAHRRGRKSRQRVRFPSASHAIRADVLSWLVPSFCRCATARRTTRSCAALARRNSRRRERRVRNGRVPRYVQPQRGTNLKIRLEEYLRFGLEAGSSHETSEENFITKDTKVRNRKMTTKVTKSFYFFLRVSSWCEPVSD